MVKNGNRVGPRSGRMVNSGNCEGAGSGCVVRIGNLAYMVHGPCQSMDRSVSGSRCASAGGRLSNTRCRALRADRICHHNHTTPIKHPPTARSRVSISVSRSAKEGQSIIRIS